MRLATSTARTDLVFVSYSHEDVKWCQKFRVMLDPLVDKGEQGGERSLELRADERIAPGDYWRQEIEDAIDRASLALLLVSPDFLAYPFINDKGLPTLRERNGRLVPVLVRPCLWRAVPALSEVQWALGPERCGALG